MTPERRHTVRHAFVEFVVDCLLFGALLVTIVALFALIAL